MLERLIPVFQSDSQKSAADVLARLQGLSTMVALDTLYSLLQRGLAGSRDSSAAKALMESCTPSVEEWSERAIAELAAGDDNPVRRELCGKRLSLLAEQLANACYVEAMRARADLQKGRRKSSVLAYWAAAYFRWLGLAHTARALLDAMAPLSWEGPCTIYFALARFGGVPDGPIHCKRQPLRALAYLLLINDAFPVASEAGVAIAARACERLAPLVAMAPDFHRVTPFVLSAQAGTGQRLVGWGGPSKTEPALCYGLEEVAEQLLRACDDIQGGQAPSWLKESIGAETILRRVAACWVAGPGRARNAVLLKRPETRAAFDFLRVRGLVGQRGQRVPSEDPLIQRIRMEDADDLGVSFLIAADAAPLLDRGIVAIIVGRTHWWLARIRRVELLSDALFVCASWLGSEVEAVRIVGRGDAWRAVYLHPGTANGYQAGLVVDTGSLNLGANYQLDSGDMKLTLRPRECIVLGSGTWWYPCDMLAGEPA